MMLRKKYQRTHINCELIFQLISLLKPHTTLVNYFWSKFQMEQMVVNLNKNKKSKNLTHEIIMGWRIMISKHSTAYVGFDSLCSNKSSGLYYSEEKKKKSVFLSYSLKILNTKYMDAMEQVFPPSV